MIFLRDFWVCRAAVLGGPAESEAPEGSQGLYSVELFSPGPGAKAKCYFSLLSGTRCSTCFPLT